MRGKKTQEIVLDLDVLEKIDSEDMLRVTGECLKEYRKRFKYTREDIAQKIGVSQAIVARIERGQQNLTVKMLVKIWTKLSTDKYNFGGKILRTMLATSKENYELRHKFN